MMIEAPDIAFVYGDGPHPLGTVERLANGRWRASTKRLMLDSTYSGREEALEALHRVLDGDVA
jgi:hypothetical protein